MFQVTNCTTYQQDGHCQFLPHGFARTPFSRVEVHLAFLGLPSARVWAYIFQRERGNVSKPRGSNLPTRYVRNWGDLARKFLYPKLLIGQVGLSQRGGNTQSGFRVELNKPPRVELPFIIHHPVWNILFNRPKQGTSGYPQKMANPVLCARENQPRGST